MLLKLVKQLSPEIAAKLNYAREAEKKFLLLNDCQFLSSAYAEHINNFKPERGEELKASIVKKLGVFTFPSAGLRFCDNRVTFDTHLGVEVNKRITEGTLAFDCGKHNYNTGLTLQLRDIAHGTDFWESETLYSPWFLDFSKEEKSFGKGNILNMSVNFYNNKLIYEKIHSILLKNRSEYEKSFGKTFMEGLMLLFSVEIKPQKVKPILISSDYLSEALVKNIRIKNYQTLGLHHYTQEQVRGWVATGNKIELLLDAKNQLTILVFHPKYADNYPFLVSEKSEEFKRFLEANLEAWLNQIIQMTDFCNNIFEKVKLKLLLENI